MNRTDCLSFRPHLDADVKYFFGIACRMQSTKPTGCQHTFRIKILALIAQNEVNVNSIFNMISKLLLIRYEHDTVSHEICEEYFQLLVNPC